MADRYILDGHTPVKCDDVRTWAEWYGANTSQRVVANTKTPNGEVSTVFLATDHAWGQRPPVLFETMVFGGSLDDECERYCTWEEAEAGHERMVQLVTHAVEAPDAD